MNIYKMADGLSVAPRATFCCFGSTPTERETPLALHSLLTGGGMALGLNLNEGILARRLTVSSIHRHFCLSATVVCGQIGGARQPLCLPSLFNSHLLMRAA